MAAGAGRRKSPLEKGLQFLVRPLGCEKSTEKRPQQKHSIECILHVYGI